MKLLDGKTALITGASRGIGKAIAKEYAKQGANVAFTYLNSEDSAKALEDELKVYEINVKSYKSDASDFRQAEQLIASVLEDFENIDILINNAGVTKDNLLMRMSEDQWDAVIGINLKSVYNLTKAAIKPLLKNRNGSIINISSIVGMTGNPGQSNYAASKAGIIGFTKSIAQELGSRNIRSNAIAPGFIETDMTEELNDETKEAYLKNIPLKRLGSSEEIANVSVFLGSDLATYVNGQVISVCGGLNT